jgi:hypothetical protein
VTLHDFLTYYDTLICLVVNGAGTVFFEKTCYTAPHSAGEPAAHEYGLMSSDGTIPSLEALLHQGDEYATADNTRLL